MEPQARPHILLHPSVIPARWLEVANILADMDEAKRKDWIEGLRNRAWAAGWLPAEYGPSRIRILGSVPKALTNPLERIGDTLDAWSLEDTIARSYSRQEVGYWLRMSS